GEASGCLKVALRCQPRKRLEKRRPAIDGSCPSHYSSLRACGQPGRQQLGSVLFFGEIGSLFATTLANPPGSLFLDRSHSLAPSGPSAVPAPSSVLLLAGVLVV